MVWLKASRTTYDESNLDQCTPTEFAACASGRTISVAWSCRDQLKVVQDCMVRLYVFRSTFANRSA